MATYAPAIGGTNGKPVAVAATASAGTTIHTATNESGKVSEIYMEATNIHTDNHLLTLQLGGTTDAEKALHWIPAQSTVQVLAGHRMNGGAVIRAYADSANKINLVVDENTITL